MWVYKEALHKNYGVSAGSQGHCFSLNEHMSHSKRAFSPLCSHSSPEPFRAERAATFLNGGQTGRELPHTARSGSRFQLVSKGNRRGPPITSLGGAKRAIQFLKAAMSVLFFLFFLLLLRGGGRGDNQQRQNTLFFQSKSTSTLQLKSFPFFLFIKCEITC